MNRGNRTFAVLFLLLLPVITCCHALAETGTEGWLRYARVTDSVVLQRYDMLPSHIVVLGDTSVDRTAGTELQRGLSSMLGRNFTVAYGIRQPTNIPDAIVICGVKPSGHNAAVKGLTEPLQPEAFTLSTRVESHTRRVIILGSDDRGALYGVFHLLELVGTSRPLPISPIAGAPSSPIRWVNQWDNFDGTIERGYAGRSIFFDKGPRPLRPYSGLLIWPSALLRRDQWPHGQQCQRRSAHT